MADRVLVQTLDRQSLDSTNPRRTKARQYKPQTSTNPRQVQTLDSTNPRQVQTLDRYKPQTGTNPRHTYKPQTDKIEPQREHLLGLTLNL